MASYPALNEFGYYSGPIFGGSVIVEGPTGSHLAVLARVAKKVGTKSEDILVAEDYTGFSIPAFDPQ